MGRVLNAEHFHIQLDRVLRQALLEDMGERGDCTSESIFSVDDAARARICSKEPGVVSGVYALEPLMAMVEPRVGVELLCRDGDTVAKGSCLARLDGPVRAILGTERIMLNLLQRFSGIATQTAELVRLCAGTRARVLDTRKTTPTLRIFEKAAVVHGGGENHRFGLFDRVLIKDTHVKACGGPGAAIRRVRERLRNPELALEVEVQSEEEFVEALAETPDRIMLDNMAPALMSRCVALRDVASPRVELEASGNIGPRTIAGVAATGVDYISAGCITHSAPALDIHLVLE